MAKKTLADMSIEELDAEFASAQEQFTALRDAGITADTKDKAAELAQYATEIKARKAELATAAAELESSVTALSSVFDAEPAPVVEEAPAAPAAVEPPAAVAAEVAAPQVFDITDFMDKLGTTLAAASKPAVVVEPEVDGASLVAAAAANSAHPAPLTEARLSGLAVITASAESKDGKVVRGQNVDLKDLSTVMSNTFGRIAGGVPQAARDFANDRMEQFALDYQAEGPAALERWTKQNPLPTFDGISNITQFPIGTIAKPETPELVIDVDQPASEHNDNAIKAAIERAKLKDNPLARVAAGGWCAPSEVIYDLTEMETRDGIYSIPEVIARRGGINRTLGPDYSSAFASTVFSQTEANAIAGTSKASVQVACPSFTETRMGVRGVNLVAPLLTEAAWPELTARFQRGALVYYAHSTNAAVLAAIETALGTTVTGPNPTAATIGLGAATQNVLDMTEFLINQQRSKYRLGLSQLFDVIAPMWLKGVIRADLAARNGVDFLAISDAQIEAYFRVRGANVSFVYDWQDIVQTAGSNGYADSVKLMIFPAGTFVRLTTNVINLSAVYDQASLATNMFTSLFMEEGFAVMRAGYGGVLTTIPIPVTGLTAANTVVTPFNDSQAV